MDVFDVYAKLSLDTREYDQNMDDAGNKANVFASVLSANLATKAIGMAVDGLKRLGEAAVDTFKQAISSYADYEQYVGGVETLFGSSAKKVIHDAEEAYKTAGMTANQYLETSIQSAARLINSLNGDQEKAAEIMNMSITDMADNVNKMGTTMEAVQNAYRGFSRGNFMMLDNLALGFSGTRQGMEELLAKAKEFAAQNGETRDFSIESYADIVEAIHVVQEEMGITGTTSKEANETISGSVATVKAAWQNLVTGIANGNADIDKLIDNFVKSAGTALDNLIPVAERALDGIIEVGIKMLPKFIELGGKIAGAIVKGIIASPIKLLWKALEALGITDFGETVTKRVMGYARGGDFGAGDTFVAGEDGAELITSKTAGHVYNAEETADILGGKRDITVNINIDGDVYDDEISMRKKLRNAVIDVIELELAHG